MTGTPSQPARHDAGPDTVPGELPTPPTPGVPAQAAGSGAPVASLTDPAAAGANAPAAGAAAPALPRWRQRLQPVVDFFFVPQAGLSMPGMGNFERAAEGVMNRQSTQRAQQLVRHCRPRWWSS